MKVPKNPTFRKEVTSWHESDLFCLLISAFSAFVFYFSVEGMGVALDHDAYRGHVWVPILLMCFSAALLVWNLFRILSRMVQRPGGEE